MRPESRLELEILLTDHVVKDKFYRKTPRTQ